MHDKESQYQLSVTHDYQKARKRNSTKHRDPRLEKLLMEVEKNRSVVSEFCCCIRSRVQRQRCAIALNLMRTAKT
jgi:hypothetical protein